MPSVTCPTCLTVLRTADGWSPSEPVLCPNCDRRIWVGRDVRADDRPASTFWEELPIDEVLGELASALPQPPGAIPPAADTPPPVTVPTARRSSRGLRWAVSTASVAFSAGLFLALAFAVSSDGRNELTRMAATLFPRATLLARQEPRPPAPPPVARSSAPQPPPPSEDRPATPKDTPPPASAPAATPGPPASSFV